MNRDNSATFLGLAMAVLNAWVNVDWDTFELDFRHVAPLVISAGIAAGGYLSTFKKKP